MSESSERSESIECRESTEASENVKVVSCENNGNSESIEISECQ